MKKILICLFGVLIAAQAGYAEESFLMNLTGKQKI